MPFRRSCLPTHASGEGALRGLIRQIDGRKRLVKPDRARKRKQLLRVTLRRKGGRAVYTPPFRVGNIRPKLLPVKSFLTSFRWSATLGDAALCQGGQGGAVAFAPGVVIRGWMVPLLDQIKVIRQISSPLQKVPKRLNGRRLSPCGPSPEPSCFRGAAKLWTRFLALFCRLSWHRRNLQVGHREGGIQFQGCPETCISVGVVQLG